MTTWTRRCRIASAYVACTIGAVACHDTVGPAAHFERQLSMSGRAERGAVVRFSVAGGDPTVVSHDSILSLAVMPADAAMIVSDSVRLVATGPIVVTATLADRAVLSTTIQVATPPTLVFEGLGAQTGRDIYRVALDGIDLTRLTQHSADDVQPTVLDGFVVFTSYRDGNGELYSVRLDGSAEQRLTRTPAVNETMPALSPDGRSIVYLNDASGVTKVWIASRDLSDARRLTPADFGSPAGVETSPAWNSTSDRFAFVATAGPSGRASIFTSTRMNGAIPAIVAGSGSVAAEFEPTWSPDGGRIAYASVVSGITQIFMRDLATSAVTQLTFDTTSCGQPMWLTDGRLVFVRFLTYTSQQLAWLDPAEPRVVHSIPTTGLSAQHPALVRP